jgi:DNA invertase Pin-like site-specific DNA recombinase
MLIGYARVSTDDQQLHLQKDALNKAGCELIFDDIASGAKDNRNGLSDALSHLRDGDTLVVWRLDRLARSLKNLIDIVSKLANRNIGLKSLQESIDTTTSGGTLVFHIFGALAEFERTLIRERTKAGLDAARVRGRKGGRPIKCDATKLDMARQQLKAPNASIKDICKALNISKATLYRHLSKIS